MKWLLLVLPLLGGCNSLKTKTIGMWCVGACMRVDTEKDTNKQKDEAPKDPAPADDAT
jgi:hypothetical protein